MTGRHAKPIDCPDHWPVQHRDGKPPWCSRCGLTEVGEEPVSSLPRELPTRPARRDRLEPAQPVARRLLGSRDTRSPGV